MGWKPWKRLVSALGVASLRWSLDTPTGATIVCTFGAVLILMFLVHLLFFHGRKRAISWTGPHRPKPVGSQPWKAAGKPGSSPRVGRGPLATAVG